MDTSIFLGGKEPTTLKELAAVLGKETIDTVRPDRALSKVAVSYTHLDVYKRQDLGYEKALDSQTKGQIKILSHAKVCQGNLHYDRTDQLR